MRLARPTRVLITPLAHARVLPNAFAKEERGCSTETRLIFARKVGGSESLVTSFVTHSSSAAEEIPRMIVWQNVTAAAGCPGNPADPARKLPRLTDTGMESYPAPTMLWLIARSSPMTRSARCAKTPMACARCTPFRAKPESALDRRPSPAISRQRGPSPSWRCPPSWPE